METAVIAPPPVRKNPYADPGKWCTYEEVIRSSTATKYGLSNVPNAAQWARVLHTYNTIYAPLCEWAGEKIPINSWFRSLAVNNIVPGASSTSLHLHGAAVDLDCQKFNNPITNNQLFERIRTHLPFCELILEAPDGKGVASWIHVATDPKPHKQSIKKMVKTKTGPSYIYWPFRV